MPDWGLVAVIVAFLAYPLQVAAVPAFLDLFGRIGERLRRWIIPHTGQCIALEWETHFINGPFHPKGPRSQRCTEPDCSNYDKIRQRLWGGSWEEALSLFFPNPWERAVAEQRVDKPHQLSSKTQYVRTNPEVLLLYVYFSALIGADKYQKFDHFVQVTEHNGVLVARMAPAVSACRMGFRYNSICGKLQECTKSELEAIINGESRQFPKRLALLPHDEIDNPLASKHPGDEENRINGVAASWRRGGWVVALGMTSMSAIWPHFLQPFVRSGLQQSSFRYTKGGEYMMLPQHVNYALLRVINTLKALGRVFVDNNHLHDALAMTSELRFTLSPYLMQYSGLEINLEWVPLFGSSIRNIWRYNELSPAFVDARDLTVRIFNGDIKELNWDERNILRPVLRDVCRAAIVGMLRVFHFYEHGNVMKMPELLGRYKHVYLENNSL